MLSIPLLRRTVRTNGRLWLSAVGLMALQTALALWLYASGRADAGTRTLTEYLGFWLFEFVYPALSVLYGILTANRLMVRKIENGTMAYLLSGPNKRVKIANTQACFLSLALLAAYVCTAAFGIAGCMIWFPGRLKILPFVLLHIGCFCLSLAFGGVGFWISCMQKESRRSLLFGLGIPLVFLGLRMAADLGGGWEFLKYLSVFTLFRPAEILGESSSVYWKFLLLAAAGAAFMRLGVKHFEKRDLPL